MVHTTKVWNTPVEPSGFRRQPRAPEPHLPMFPQEHRVCLVMTAEGGLTRCLVVRECVRLRSTGLSPLVRGPVGRGFDHVITYLHRWVLAWNLSRGTSECSASAHSGAPCLECACPGCLDRVCGRGGRRDCMPIARHLGSAPTTGMLCGWASGSRAAESNRPAERDEVKLGWPTARSGRVTPLSHPKPCQA